uniref:Uncharacterized protein n=1 Tax=Cajanus cajan TaxID=3821 RepID=A0A151R458_CAJCA|nr:hypothetical protein KK1_041512 [Cajanus cajan]
MAGRAAETADNDGEVALFPQHMTSCLPLASMAQKTWLSPKEAEIGPMAPKPCTAAQRNMRNEKSERVCDCMVGFGTVSWSRRWEHDYDSVCNLCL